MRLPIACLMAALVTTAFVACHGHHHSRFPGPPSGRHASAGPPPHAPAHGYRHKRMTRMGEVQLVFDSGIGVYVVVGHAGHYFYRGNFYRSLNSVWHVSAHIDTGWAVVGSQALPRGLAKNQGKGKAKVKGKHKQHPAKHGY